jgi:protein-tyrosine sulfotransferase
MSTTTSTSEAGKPLFILSCARSGSTLLRYILDTHPEICSPAELNLGALCKALHATLYDTIAVVSCGGDEQARERVALAEVRRRVTEIMEAYARSKNKSRWCEKSPMNLNHLDILQRVFPDAHYICLYRHGLDVAHSCLELSRQGFVEDLFVHVQSSPQNLVAAMIDYWNDRTARLLAFEKQHRTQCFAITFESLVFRPADTLQSLCAFLGVEWRPEILSRIFSTHHDEGAGDRKILFSKEVETQAVGKGAMLSQRRIPTSVIERMSSLLLELGYPVLGPDWSSWPHRQWLDAQTRGHSLDARSVQDFFVRCLPQRLDARNGSHEAPKAVFRVVVDGKDRDHWMIDLTGTAARIYRGDDRADCTMMVSESDLMAIVNGRLNAGAAFAQGRLRADEKLGLARTLGKAILGA